jgi:UDP-N-acetylmuramoylalanine-D-glutamate ligase
MQKTDKKNETQLISARKRSLKAHNKLPFSRQWIKDINGVNFINDAVSSDLNWAIESIHLAEKPIIWIVGQITEKINYDLLKKHLNGKVEAIISFGEYTKSHHYKMSALVPFYNNQSNLEEAVQRAWSVSNPTFTILFSPACYDNQKSESIEDRGHFFNHLINKLN